MSVYGYLIPTGTLFAVPGVLVEMVDHSAEESSTHLVDGQICLGLSTVDVESVSGSGEREE